MKDRSQLQAARNQTLEATLIQRMQYRNLSRGAQVQLIVVSQNQPQVAHNQILETT